MALVGRLIPEVAACGDEHVRAEDVERACNLLARRVMSDPRRPHLVAIDYRKLVDEPVRACRIEVAAARIGNRRGGRYLGRALIVADVPRDKLPQALASCGVERDGAPVGGRDDIDVLGLTVDLYGVQLDGGRVGHAG